MKKQIEDFTQLYRIYLFGEKPEPTALQKQIEMAVTNGLGYDTGTQYVERKPDQLISLANDSQIHDTPEGLRIHLAELDSKTNPSRRLNDLIKTYKRLAVDMAELPYMEIVDQMPKPDYNKKAVNF
jgi:hypothetical protein